MYSALVELGNQKQMNVSQLLASAIQGAVQGNVPLKSPGGQDICPRCGHQAHLIQDDSKFYFWCRRCDWCGYLGQFTLPTQIEDYREKIKEV